MHKLLWAREGGHRLQAACKALMRKFAPEWCAGKAKAE